MNIDYCINFCNIYIGVLFKKLVCLWYGWMVQSGGCDLWWQLVTWQVNNEQKMKIKYNKIYLQAQRTCLMRCLGLLWIPPSYLFLPCVLLVFYSLFLLFHVHHFTLTGAVPRRLRSSTCNMISIIYTQLVDDTTTSSQPRCTQPLFTNHYLNQRTE